MKTSDLTLRLTESSSDAWDNAIAPWCDRVLPECWKRARPAAIVVPTRGHANAIKQRLLDAGRSYFGLHFITPGPLRERLARAEGVAPPPAEDLRLLLAVAASSLPDDLTAKAVARSPGSLLQTLNRLQAAGWDFEQLALPAFAPVVRRFLELLRRCDFLLPGEMERKRSFGAANGPLLFSDLLVTGFDGAHWADWFLLRAAVARADKATVLLDEPRSFQEIDLCWIGSWEEIAGEAQRRAPAAVAGPASDALFSEAEMRGETRRAPHYDFLVGLNYSEQAEAIARQCLVYLAEENCRRLGVIFASAGALPRLVSSALARLGLPHNDNLAHIVPGIFENAEWQAWLELQRVPRLESLLHFVNVLPDFATFAAAPLSISAFERTLRERHREVSLDDLDILRAACLAAGDERSQLVVRTLEAFPLLPARATFSQFLEQTHAALARLKWPQRAIEIGFAERDWALRLPNEMSRSLFLRWLEETATSFGAARAPAGDHPYARVHLLTVAHAQNQEWSHLIFAGCNEGAWPPPPGAEFAREEEIRAFNQRAQQLNKRAARQGNQGEGHTTVREGNSLYLGPAEQRAIALRQFEALRESATEKVTLTASLVREDAPERFWNPSECFTRLYFEKRQAPLTQAALAQLQRNTVLLPNDLRPSPEVTPTRTAFAARRDAIRPAGEYDFAFRPNESPLPPPTLSVSELQRMVKAPAVVWLKRYLGVEAAEEDDDQWLAVTGQWVHRWLAAIARPEHGKLFASFPTARTVDERVCAAADEQRAALEKLCRSLGKTIPDWWTSGWLNARFLGRHLGAKIAGVNDWPWMVTEFRIGHEGPVRIAEDIEFQLHGQLDLILAQKQAADFAGATLWVIDYKTGSAKKPTGSELHDKLIKGDPLQIAFYALALRALGATEVDASLVASGIKDVKSQLKLDDLLPHTNIFRDLAEMQRTGIYGMKGELRAAFGARATYPLATLAIDPDVLEDKWALTHPELVLHQDEWETF